jgi:hypothetical protein
LWVPISGRSKNFNIFGSSTAKITKERNQIQYGSGFVSGLMGSDKLTIKNLNINITQNLLWSDYQDSDIQVNRIKEQTFIKSSMFK